MFVLFETPAGYSLFKVRPLMPFGLDDEVEPDDDDDDDDCAPILGYFGRVVLLCSVAHPSIDRVRTSSSLSSLKFLLSHCLV